MNKGLLIVIDGIDGSGKTTQIDLLSKSLKEKNIAHEVISFPRYEDNLYGKLIRRYLNGEFGGISQVSPYLMALAYAGDRALAKPLIENWLNDGKIVLANRYVSSSYAHMSAKLPENQQEEFMEWVRELEYGTNKIPKEDLTILLQVDVKLGQDNVKGGDKDIHEDNFSHLEKANKIYQELTQADPDLIGAEENWEVIDCMKDKQMRTPQDISQEIVKIVESVILSRQ